MKGGFDDAASWVIREGAGRTRAFRLQGPGMGLWGAASTMTISLPRRVTFPTMKVVLIFHLPKFALLNRRFGA
jgi:hypothetical protein